MKTIGYYRDLIEEEIYIGEGTTLGVTDAATVIFQSVKQDIESLEGEVKQLREFVGRFLDNFKPCDKCEGGLFMGDTCPKCYGTAEIIDSVGIFYIDLPQTARELLGKDVRS
jgi:hypothetical protein